MPWYGLHVRSNFEHLVAAKLAGESIPSFYPFVLRKSRDGKRTTETRFMPGYVFAEFDLADKTPVVAIAQVVSILGFGSHAASIPDAEIENTRKIVSFPKLVEPCEFLAAGDKVRVLYGPLTGLEGIVQRWKKKAWVVVSIATAERSLRAEVDPSSLELVQAHRGKA